MVQPGHRLLLIKCNDCKKIIAYRQGESKRRSDLRPAPASASHQACVPVSQHFPGAA
jgi:hypothetical protein